MPDRLAEMLQNTRIHQESASHALSVGDVGHWCLKAAVDVDMPRLLALADAVLGLTRDSEGDPVHRSCDLTVGDLLDAVSRALLGEEAS